MPRNERGPKPWSTSSAANKAREHRKSHPEQHFGHVLKYKYGITLQQYHQLLAEQGGRCGNLGCRRAEPLGRGAWHVDHDHTTGRIRGLLCAHCNLMIGQAHDSVQRLRGAAEYLLAHEPKLRVG